MNAQEILKLEEEAVTFLGLNIQQFFLISLAVAFFLLIITYILVNKAKTKTKKNIIAIVGSLISICISLNSIVLIPMQINKNYSKWEKEVAYPYIESLETKKYEIKNLSIGVTIEDPSELDFSMYTDGTYSNSTVDVSYVNDEEKTVKLKAKIKVIFDLEKGEDSYIQFKSLDENLGTYLKKGIYNAEIHLQKVNFD